MGPLAAICLALSVLFYGVVSGTTESVVEFFPTPQGAAAMIAEVEADEPELAGTLRVEVVEFELSPN